MHNYWVRKSHEFFDERFGLGNEFRCSFEDEEVVAKNANLIYHSVSKTSNGATLQGGSSLFFALFDSKQKRQI